MSLAEGVIAAHVEGMVDVADARLAVQRIQVRTRLGEPVHVPSVAVKICPCDAVPVTRGTTVLPGIATNGMTVGETAAAEPSPVFAVTSTRRYERESPAVTR